MTKNRKTPRGMYLRENGIWYCRIAGPDGKLIRKRLSEDKKTAIILLNEMRKKVELQKAGILPDTVEREFKTFEELHREYLKHLKSRAVAESTVRNYLTAHKRVVLENRFVYLADMTVAKVEEWARNVAGSIKGQTVNYYVGMIGNALQWAHENGYVRRSPLAKWEDVRKNEPRYRRDFQPEEVKRFFEVEKDPVWRLRWLLYFTTALRSDAGRAVCWEWIDWVGRVLRLPMESNKSRRVHEIPLSASLLDALAVHKAKLGGEPRGPIFPAVNINTILRRLKKKCKKAGIDTHGLCVHSIRHTVATMIYEGTGKNLKAVQEVLGHTNPATTMRYLHITEEVKRQAIDSLDLGFGVGSLSLGHQETSVQTGQ